MIAFCEYRSFEYRSKSIIAVVNNVEKLAFNERVAWGWALKCFRLLRQLYFLQQEVWLYFALHCCATSRDNI